MRTLELTLLTAAALLLFACGDRATEIVQPPPPVQNELVFTRADGSRISFASGASLFVWCGPWEEGLIPTPSLQILLYGPASGDPGWSLRAVVADVRPGEPVRFPNEFVWDHPRGVDVFVLDPPNELTTNLGDAAGSITFEQLKCGGGGTVQFSIDAVLSSEFSDGTPVAVKGRFRAPIGPAPAAASVAATGAASTSRRLRPVSHPGRGFRA